MPHEEKTHADNTVDAGSAAQNADKAPDIEVPPADPHAPKSKRRGQFRFSSVVALANRKLSVKFAAVVLASSTLVSALLGFFAIASSTPTILILYPTGIDAYTAAFTIPDFMFFILTSGRARSQFHPSLQPTPRLWQQKIRLGSSPLAFSTSWRFMTLVASILIMIFADPLVRYIVGPGLDESGTILAINMMRVIAINPFLFSISTILPVFSKLLVASSSTPLRPGSI